MNNQKKEMYFKGIDELIEILISDESSSQDKAVAESLLARRLLNKSDLALIKEKCERIDRLLFFGSASIYPRLKRFHHVIRETLKLMSGIQQVPLSQLDDSHVKKLDDYIHEIITGLLGEDLAGRIKKTTIEYYEEKEEDERMKEVRRQRETKRLHESIISKLSKEELAVVNLLEVKW